MYFATREQSEKENLKFYYDLIDRFIEKDDKTHEELFRSILINTYLVASGMKSYYDIDRAIYDVVSKLIKSEYNKNYFKENIDIYRIEKKDFVTLRNILGSLYQEST